MKIIFIVGSYPNVSETFIYNQIYYLIKRNFNVEILSIRKTDQDLIHSKFTKYHIFNNVKFLNSTFKINYFYGLICGFSKSIKIINQLGWKKSFLIIQNYHLFKSLNSFDIIHSHFGDVGELVGKYYYFKILYRPRFIHTFHGFDLLPNNLLRYKFRYKNLYKFSNVITVNSNYTQKLVEKSNRKILNKVIKIPMGIDLNFFDLPKIKSRNSEFTIIFCGRLVSWKAPLFALSIFKSFNELKLNSRFFIVGQGELKNECVEFVKNNGLDSKVTLFESLSQEELKNLFLESDVLLMPGTTDLFTGRAENQGLVIQEAQALKIPVIVSNAGGMSEGMLDGKSGYVIPEGNLRMFVEKLLILYDNPNLKNEMGDYGRSFVKKNMDIEILGESLLHCYKS